MKLTSETSWINRYGWLIVVALPVVFYLDFLLGKVFIWEDALVLSYPHANYILKSLASGRFPLWLANLGDGMPYLGEPKPIFYPFTWLMLPFMSGGRLPVLVYQWNLVVQICLGGFFMYLFLKELGFRMSAVLLGVTVFCFSGFTSLHFNHNTFLHTYIWLPLEMLLVRKAVATGKLQFYLGLALALAVSVHGGHPQIPLYTGYLLVAYWVFCFLTLVRPDSGAGRWAVGRSALRELFRMGAVFAVVLGLCAVIILPIMENLRLSTRAAWGLREMADQSLPMYYLMHFLVPNFFGTTGVPGFFGGGTAPPVPFWGADKSCFDVQKWGWGAWQYWEFGSYAGQIALLAVVVLLWNVRRLERRRETVFFLAAAFAALWFMLGRYGGLFNVLYHVLPGAALFRIPPRMACVLDFALAVVAALFLEAVLTVKNLDLKRPFIVVAGGYVVALVGYQALVSAVVPPQLGVSRAAAFALQQLVVSVVFCCALGGVLWLMRSEKMQRYQVPLVCGVVLLTFADLYHAFGSFHRGKTNPDEYLSDRAAVMPQLARMQEETGPFRFEQMRDGGSLQEVIFPNGAPFFFNELNFTGGYFVFDVRDVTAFQKLQNPIAKLDLQNVRVIANLDSVQQRVQLKMYTNSLPRVAFYTRHKKYDSTAKLLAALDNGELSYKEEVGVLSSDAPQLTSLRTATQGTNLVNRVAVISHLPEEYRIRYQTQTPGVIFVSETFYPGWEVINQKNAVIKVFGAFLGVVVPEAGDGEIVLRYRPATFRVGALISGSVLSGVLVVALAMGLTGRLRKPQN